VEPPRTLCSYGTIPEKVPKRCKNPEGYFPRVSGFGILPLLDDSFSAKYPMFRSPLIALLAFVLAFPAFAAVHPARKVHHAATHRHVVRHTARRRVVHHTVHHHLSYAERVRLHRRYEAHLRYEEHLRAVRRIREEHVEAARLRAERLHHGRGSHSTLARREHTRLTRRRAARTELAARHAAPEEATPAAAPAQVAENHAPTAAPAKAALDTAREEDAEYIPADIPEHIHLYYYSPLRGTHASLLRQNQRDEAEGLHRIQTEAQLEEMVSEHKLIHLPLSTWLHADVQLAPDRQYVRPWTAHFLMDLSRAHAMRFHDALTVTSAVRPERYQAHLLMINGNAAPATGAIASPHEFGATIDIGKKGMRMSEIAWMRGYLLLLQEAGKIDVEEEFHQACFHITVYDNYGRRKPLHRLPAADLLAAHIP